jgi:polyhydroxyalkanoate synthesis regulator phasin
MSTSSGSGSSRKRSSGGAKTKSSAKKSSTRKTTSSARKQAAKKGGQARGRQQKARKAAKKTSRGATRPLEEFSGKSVAEFRQALNKNLIRPFELVMLSRDRIEDAMDEVVRRGRMTRDDATQLAQALFTLGRQQTEDVMRDLEQLLGRGRSNLEERTGRVRERSVSAATAARKQMGQATTRARKAADPLLIQADRARRTAGVGSTFPITGYDDLTAAQIQARLVALSPAELRKVRDYERRRGNRKSVLDAIEAKLA